MEEKVRLIRSSRSKKVERKLPYLSTVTSLGFRSIKEAHAFLAVVVPIALFSFFLPVCHESSLTGYLELALVANDNHVVCRI